VLSRLDTLDAVMLHLFEADLLCALRSHVRRKPVLISSTDEAPIIDRANYPLYPSDLTKPRWRQRLRLALDRWRVGRMRAFIPFSAFAADILVRGCGVPAKEVHPIHVGLDLELWKSTPRSVELRQPRLQILFVGGDFVRKGGDVLLEVFKTRFQDTADLHLVTKQAPKDLPEHVLVYNDFSPNDPRLTALYAASDVLVIPTTADLGPLWVFLEAMAMRLPIIATDTGASTEAVRDGETGWVIKPNDPESLTRALHALLDNPGLRRQMGENGRALIEQRFDASVNVPRILGIMKDAVDAAPPR
jgi:glycosyltransferase involved in cell wall biosynthesis